MVLNVSGNFQETSQKLFYFVKQLVLVPPGLLMKLHPEKLQFWGCKQVSFNKSWKVLLGNFLWWKISRKIFLLLFVCYPSSIFFHQGNLSENLMFMKNIILYKINTTNKFRLIPHVKLRTVSFCFKFVFDFIIYAYVVSYGKV